MTSSAPLTSMEYFIFGAAIGAVALGAGIVFALMV